jgi:hypothetical protein
LVVAVEYPIVRRLLVIHCEGVRAAVVDLPHVVLVGAYRV